MRLFYLFFFVISPTILHAQQPVKDVASSQWQNYLPMEGGGYMVSLDSTTSTKDLVERLKGKWDLQETGKAYWIGYTDDMFSIAARGDSAITLLTELIESDAADYTKYGALLSLHLIGIDRTVQGRDYEEFTNKKGRKALLDALSQTELQQHIVSLLCRAPRKSDIPYVMKVIETDSSDCWALNNYLTAFSLNLPISQDIPKTFYGKEIKIKCDDNLRHKPSAEFNAVVRGIRASEDPHINVDSNLLGYKSLWGYGAFGILDCDKKHGIEKVDITEILYKVTAVTYMDIGCRLQYYVENGNVFICTQATAKQRLLSWWNSLIPNERKELEDDRPVSISPFSDRMFQYMFRNSK